MDLTCVYKVLNQRVDYQFIEIPLRITYKQMMRLPERAYFYHGVAFYKRDCKTPDRPLYCFNSWFLTIVKLK